MIKEFCRTSAGYRIVIRDNAYGSSLDKFEDFFAIAKNDFPALLSSDVEIAHYGGKRYARTFGIEFMSFDKPSKEYVEVNQLENTL